MQPSGGQYNSILGVHAGIEALRLTDQWQLLESGQHIYHSRNLMPSKKSAMVQQRRRQSTNGMGIFGKNGIKSQNHAHQSPHSASGRVRADLGKLR